MRIMHALAALLIATLSACGGGAPPEMHGRPKPVVKVAKAESEDIFYTLDGIGQIQPFATVDIEPQVTGKLMEVYFTDGATVQKGDLLFSIDSQSYQAALDQAQAQLQQAEANLEIKQQKVARYKDLLKEDYVAKLDYEQYVSDVEAAQGLVNQNIAAVTAARINLDRCQIMAPISGRLGSRLVYPGAIVNTTVKLITINQIEPIYANFSLPERFFPLLREYFMAGPVGVEVSVPGDDKNVHEGTLDFINNGIDPMTGTIAVRAVLPNKQHLLWPGLFIRVKVKLYAMPHSIIVPTRAIQLDTEGQFVFVIAEGNKAEKRPVTLGQKLGERQVVKEGLQAGDTVVTEGQLALAPGSEVTIKE